ncbi:mersacidin/lichenicidin family type 2 lantibiotic [Alkalinema pantanalense CENA528]|uniref:mersacidin/lichenicidin family type 2 lantibiotic n=1 Tax=Alkalinema pantanalense TaxID=1620705 RepID=UPI003D6EA2AD
MSQENVIRFWKDEFFRDGFNNSQLTELPTNPAGLIQLADADLEAVVGGFNSCLAGSHQPVCQDRCGT